MKNNVATLGQAIYCNCYLEEFDRYKILGSITAQGVIEILRGHKNRTVIETREFVITCPVCKYTKYIKIESMEVTRPAYVNNSTSD